MKKEIKKQGWAIHVHHNILVEWCYDYDERVNYIKTEKPKKEKKTRLRLFKILPKEAIKDIPIKYRNAAQAWSEADKAWWKADKKKFHKKWCGCKKWNDNGEEIIFKK